MNQNIYFLNLRQEHERYERAAARQRDAKQRLEEHCKDGFSEVMSEPSISPFFLNRRDRMLYCIVPKVATRVLRGYFHTGHISDGNVKERFQNYTRFMFVREPFQRLLSAYRDKFKNPDHYKEKWMKYERKMIRKYRPETPEGGLESGEVVVTFKEFIGYLITNGMEEGFDWHWKPFENICRPCFLTYDFIGRYEHLQDDANFLRKEGNTQIKKPFPPMQESKSDTELVDYYSTLPPEWILRLGEIYEIDFKLFGYPFPGPLESLVKPLK